jgi:cytidylate kinase
MDGNISMYLLTGVMASGKSTVAELLAKNIKRSVHLHGDIFRKLIISGREEMSDNPTEEAFRQLNLRYKITVEVAKEYYNAGFNVIIQDNYYGKTLNEMENLLEQYNLKIIVLIPRVEIVKKREETRHKKGYVGFNIEKLYEEFIKETPKIGYWIDTSEITPEETVKKILEYYKIV